MFEFKLPDLGEGIHEGEILKWFVSVGDRIKEDEPLVDVETDKAAVTIPAPRGGKIVSLAGNVGDTITVGKVIAVIGDGEALAEPAVEAPPTLPKEKPKPGEPAVEAPPTPPKEKPKPAEPVPTAPVEVPEAPPAEAPVLAAPATRRVARELGVDIKQVRGTGKQGRVTADDVRAVAERGAKPAAPAAAKPPTGWRPVFAPPATRRLARELGVDIHEVTPTGAGGNVTAEDIKRHAEKQRKAVEPPSTEMVPAGGEQAAVIERRAEAEFAAHAASAIPFLDIEPFPDAELFGPVVREPLRSIRRKVARKMVTSMILVPHVAHMDEADVTLLEEFRQRERKKREGQPGSKLTLLAFMVKAVTAGLKASPAFNASLDPFREEIIYKKYYNIGIAVDTGKGLVVPVIRDTDRKSIVQIAKDIEELAARAREGKLEVADLRGGTFTITNVGPLGGTALIPAINYPEVAILGMSRAQDRPVVRDGQVVIRKMLPLTLAFDHRIADGADAARFVSELVRHLSDPELLLVET